MEGAWPASGTVWKLVLLGQSEEERSEMGGIPAPKGTGLAAFLDVSALRLFSVDLLLSEQHGDNTQL